MALRKPTHSDWRSGCRNVSAVLRGATLASRFRKQQRNRSVRQPSGGDCFPFETPMHNFVRKSRFFDRPPCETVFVTSQSKCVQLFSCIPPPSPHSPNKLTVFFKNCRVGEWVCGGVKKKKWHSEYKRPHQFIQRHSASLALLALLGWGCGGCSQSKAAGEQRSHRSSMRSEKYRCEETCSVLSTLTQIAKHTPDRLLHDGKLECA